MRSAERNRPRLNQLQHFIPHIVIASVANESSECLTARLVGDFLVDRRATVLHDRLEHHQRVESSVRIGRWDFLYNCGDCCLGTGIRAIDESLDLIKTQISTHVTSFCRIMSQICIIDVQSVSSLRWLVASSAGITKEILESVKLSQFHQLTQSLVKLDGFKHFDCWRSSLN